MNEALWHSRAAVLQRRLRGHRSVRRLLLLHLRRSSSRRCRAIAANAAGYAFEVALGPCARSA
jgi:hypothetical protein